MTDREECTIQIFMGDVDYCICPNTGGRHTPSCVAAKLEFKRTWGFIQDRNLKGWKNGLLH